MAIDPEYGEKVSGLKIVIHAHATCKRSAKFHEFDCKSFMIQRVHANLGTRASFVNIVFDS